jgi:hypothetical protein
MSPRPRAGTLGLSEDEQTRFELTRFVVAGAPARVASMLLDRSR